MLLNYVTIAIRRLLADPFYSCINIFGLAVGLTTFIFIFLYVQDELSFDRHWDNGGKIFRLDTQNIDDSISHKSYSAIAPILQESVPSIAKAARIMPGNFAVKYENKISNENIYFIDNEFFSIFNIEFTRGNPETAFDDPFSIVITDVMAKKIFGGKNPINERISLDRVNIFHVTGVIKTPPQNTHLKLGFLANIKAKGLMYEEDHSTNWRILDSLTYILTKDEVSVRALTSDIKNFTKEHAPENVHIKLKPISIEDVYLQTAVAGGIKGLLVLLLVAALILLMACINSINMAIAKGVKRNKELGVRKSLGATRKQLIEQFLSESIVLALCSLVLSIFFVGLFLNWFNSAVDKTLVVNYVTNLPLLGELILIAVVTGVISGSYPSFYMSRFSPSDVFKDISSTGTSSFLVRNTLIVVQFAIAIVVCIFTIFIFQQMKFMKNMELGFDKNNIVILSNIGWTDIAPNYELLKTELLQNPDIVDATRSTTVPGKELNKPIGLYAQGATKEEVIIHNHLIIDTNFFNVYKVKLLGGRTFSEDYALDKINFSEDYNNKIFNVLINESSMRKFGWKSPFDALGKTIKTSTDEWPSTLNVVGVTEDFHMFAGQVKMEPYVFFVYPQESQYMALKLSGNNIQSTLGYIDSAWNRINPHYPIVRSFLDSDLDAALKNWERSGQIMTAMTLVSVLIAMLGSFVLSGYSISVQAKEIAMRRVVGAGVLDISKLFLWKFSKPLLIANLIATPLALYVVSIWLKDFAYRISLSPTIFIVVGLMSFLICWIAVSYHIFKISSVSLAHTFSKIKY